MAFEQDDGLTKFLENSGGHRLLKSFEEQELARRWLDNGDDEARKTLMMYNLRLVISIARNFVNRGIPLSDLIQTGIIGLDRAVRKFDPGKGFKFSTYATWWIRQAIQRSVAAESKTIRVPNQISVRRLQIDSILQENPNATYEEIAKKLKCSPAQVSRAYRTAEVVTSLDQERSITAQTLLETLPDMYADDPYEQFDVEDNVSLKDALGKLTESQLTVVKLRHGLGTEDELTFSEIAERLDMALEIVQENYRTGFATLRSNLVK